MKRILQMLGTVAVCFGFATGAMAQDVIDRFDIAISAENEQTQSTLLTLATTFAVLAPRTSGQRKSSRFEFRSGTGLVAEGQATQKLRTSLPDQLAGSVTQLETMRNPCDISRHRFDDFDVLMVIHSSENEQPQDAHRCFVAALWIFHAGGAQSANVDNWRVPYARILASVAGGRPAFAGFETQEN